MQRFNFATRAPPTKTCGLCGEPLHLLKVNDCVCFWVHKGDSIRICGEQNTLYPGHPVIMQNNVSVYMEMEKAWREIVEKKNRKVKKQHERNGSAKN